MRQNCFRTQTAWVRSVTGFRDYYDIATFQLGIDTWQ
jgi:hypothetical protein